ncbi:hypothetical protein [Microcoleus sp. CZ3-B4]|uniref:hypothetical protein n=1 Tax=Microcoleus sp. CZ3-B4 TaxID=2818733 RepID=UPI002FD4664A
MTFFLVPNPKISHKGSNAIDRTFAKLLWQKGEWESGRVGEGESGRGGEWERGRIAQLPITNYQLPIPSTSIHNIR